jgi:predicted dehydrogenase
MKPDIVVQQRSLLRLGWRRLGRALMRPSLFDGIKPTRTLGVGLVGAGNVARWKYLPPLRDPSIPLRLKAVHEIDPVSAQAVATSFGVPACESIDELVRRDDVDVVFVCTPTTHHAEATLAALQAGKHVICEKPLGQSRADARRMWLASREAGSVNMVNFSYRFRPEFAYVAQLIEAGVLGRIHHIWGSISQGQWFTENGLPSAERGDAAPWKFGPDGGVLRDLGPHVLDLCRWWLGELRQIHAWTKGALPSSPSDAACGLSVSAQNGAVAHLLTSRLATGVKEQTFLELSGSNGALRFEDGRIRLWTADKPKWRDVLIPETPHFLAMFYSAVMGHPGAIPTFWDGLKNNEALDAALQSAATGKTVVISRGEAATASECAPATLFQTSGDPNLQSADFSMLPP